MALPTALLIKGGVAAATVALGGVAIFKREDIYYSIYPNDNKELNKKIRALGISGCELENKQTKRENCTLSNEQLKDVKFSDKSGAEVKVTEDSKTLTLTIEKLGDSFKTDFPEGLRFIFKNPHASEDVTIGSDSNQITLKPGVSYDFKIKTANDKTQLEKAWTLTTLGAKVGLTCQTGESTECCTTGNSLNVWKDPSNYVLEATVTTGSNSSVTVAKDQKDHNDGFKFTVTTDTNLTQNTQDKKVGSVEKLTQSNTTYEIDLKDLGDNKGKKWFLVEKTAAA